MTGFRTKITNVKLKTDATGKTTVVPVPSYASVSDKLKRGDRKKIVRGKRIGGARERKQGAHE